MRQKFCLIMSFTSAGTWLFVLHAPHALHTLHALTIAPPATHRFLIAKGGFKRQVEPQQLLKYAKFQESIAVNKRAKAVWVEL